MKLLILASILILFTIGIVGIQESFAQIYDLSDYPGEWYLGEGLKQGDYFEYSLCELDLNDCAPIKLKMWIKGEIPYESGTLWDAKVVIFDGDKTIIGSMGLGKSSPEPITFDDDILYYAIAFRSSLAWLGIFATASEDLNHGPKQFSDKTWNTQWIPIGAIGGPYPLRAETITIPAGTFDTVVVRWENNNTNEIWVVDNFPFPVKALTYTWITTGVAPIMHQYTLLDYQENIMSDPFKDVVVPEPPEKLLWCTTEFSDYVSGRVSPNTSSLLIQYDYSPEFPIEGCNIDWKINFINKYNDAELIDQIHYDIWVVDENGNRLRSYAQDLGRDELFNGFGQVHILLPVEEESGIARYTIFVHGTGPENEIPDPKLGGYATIEIEIKENPLIDESFAEQIPSPKHQLESGVAPEDILCKEERVLVIRNNGNVACVTEKTANKMNWEIIKTEFDKNQVQQDNQIVITKNKENILEYTEPIFLSDSPIFTSSQILDDTKISHSTNLQIQEYEEEVIETPDFSSCSTEFSNSLLDTLNLSTGLHMGASWWTKASHRDTNSGIVCVIDPDMNLDLEFKDSFDVSVWSTSDTNRIPITVTEISESSGMFAGNVLFTNQKHTSENKLKVTSGDTVYVNYEDETPPKPYTINDKVDLIGTSQIGWNTPKYQIEFDMNIIEELKKEYTVFWHGEEKTSIDYALSQKIKNEKHLIVCDNEVNSEQPYDPLDYPYDLFSRQYTIREHRPAPDQLLHKYNDEDSNSRIITTVQNIYNDQKLYVLNPNDFIPICLPLGQEIKFILHTSDKMKSDPTSYDKIDIIIAPNTLDILSENIINELYDGHGIKMRIETSSFMVDDDFTKFKHFMSNYGPVSYSDGHTNTLTYCSFDDEDNKICTKGFGTFSMGSSLEFIVDGKNISLSTYRYNIATLIDIASSMKNLNFEKTSDYLDPVELS